MAVLRIRRNPKAPTDPDHDAAGFHQAGDALLADTDVLVSELGMDSRVETGR